MPTARDWLNNAQSRLEAAGIATARLDGLVMLQDELNKDKSYILANPDHGLLALSVKKLNYKLKRRLSHEPLAYIRGFSEFYGRSFKVTKDTLEPRPESETMVDMLKKLPLPESIIDIGTGSGCLAITAKLELIEPKVYATDISAKCLSVARTNANNLKADVEFFKGNLLEPLAHKITSQSVILANLPYVPNKYSINKSASLEPKITIFGGPDGLDIYRKFYWQITKSPKKPSFVLTESLPLQHGKLKVIAKQAGFKLIKTDDFIQLFRS